MGSNGSSPVRRAGPARGEGGSRERNVLFLLFFKATAVERTESYPAPDERAPASMRHAAPPRPPHRRWVQETQPHTYGCAERILTAEFQLRTKAGV